MKEVLIFCRQTQECPRRQLVQGCKIAVNNFCQQVHLSATALPYSYSRVASTNLSEWLHLMLSLPTLF